MNAYVVNQVRIKNLHDATCRAIRSGKWNQQETLVKKEEAIMKRLYQDLMAKKIDYFSLVSETDFKCYHRSPKEENAVQLSAGFFKKGTLYPTYDVQIHCFDELLKEGYPSGVWNIGKNQTN